jgi:hypothetical protein
MEWVGDFLHSNDYRAGAARSLASTTQKDVFEPAAARQAIDCEIAVDTRHAPELQPLGQGHERNTGEVRRQIAVFFEQINDPRHVDRSVNVADYGLRPISSDVVKNEPQTS